MRNFARFPAAVLVCIVNSDEQILFLRHPDRDGWEVVNGAVEAGETLEQAALRETAEEAGPAVRGRLLGVADTVSWFLDEHGEYMISVVYVMAYDGGDITPGDDMLGSAVGWFSLRDLEEMRVLAPAQREVLPRVIDVYRARV